MYRIALGGNSFNLHELDIHDCKSVVAIGNFDGVHLGHQQLLAMLDDVAVQNSYKRVAIIFEPLPLEYFLDQKNQHRIPRLSLLRDKFYYLQSLVDELVVIHFNAAIADLTPQQFIQHILKQKLNAAHVVIGHDFRFGRGRSGSVEDFIKHDIECTVVEPVILDQVRVSSSIIREFANNNDLLNVTRYLGHNLHYTARIVHGKKMGRKFGVPTINLTLGKYRLALWGVYVAKVYIDHCTYNAVVSIGKNPTTNNLGVYNLEAHLLDVDLDLYGKIATIEILQFIRQECKFNDLDSLFDQIHSDIACARNYFTN
ncbi:MAG: riboflavin kinase / adenylyltransferase [Pseudomonadota bacterium]|nr:riboflavin kinase / adenylyltransferase [Pseudomonadota bacterium]